MLANLALVRRISSGVTETVAVLLYSGVMIAINWQVFMRYVANKPVRWSEELPVILLTLAVFLAISLRVRDNEHIVFDLVYHLLPEKARMVVTILARTIVLVVFSFAFPATLDFANYMQALRTPVLRIPFNFIYYFFVLMVASIAVRSAWEVFVAARCLYRGTPPEET